MRVAKPDDLDALLQFLVLEFYGRHQDRLPALNLSRATAGVRRTLRDGAVFVQVLRLVGVEIVLGDNLTRHGGDGLFVAKDGALDLAPIDELLHDDFAVVEERFRLAPPVSLAGSAATLSLHSGETTKSAPMPWNASNFSLERLCTFERFLWTQFPRFTLPTL